MKDIPMFVTEHGAASLLLKEIPYRQEAYIRIQDSQEPEELLKECTDFCSICGAEHIYASGASMLEGFPLHTVIIEMRGIADPDTDQIENLWPVTEKTVSEWRELHNRRMKCVDNAGTLEKKDEQKILESAGAYFVHKEGELLGIGWLNDDRIEAIAAVEKGAGAKVLHSILSVSPGESITLEVASTNKKAIALYQKAGFMQVGEKSRWYRIK